jgi:hypothetical protein
MFIITWLFDKLGYMPKITVDTSKPVPVKKVARKTVKITKATTRRPKTK